MFEDDAGGADRRRRAQAAQHPLRRRFLAELEAHLTLAATDFASGAQAPEGLVLYHLGELEGVGWLDLDGADPPRANLREEVRHELPTAIARGEIAPRDLPPQRKEGGG
jgi:hypothetical protein